MQNKPFETKDFSAGPLSGVKVLDLSSVIMGPFGTRILADLGAEVIRVEQPGGDAQRYYKPSRSPGMAGAILTLMRNKRSLVLDLKKESGKRALTRVLKNVDVLVHNFRPKTIEQLGFSYEKVRAINPGIIYCAAVGFGSTGPYADRPAYDDLIQAGSGMAALEGALDGVPKYVSNVVCDKLCGQTIAWSVMAALYQRASGGGGQSIEVPMLETTVDFLLVEHLYNNTLWPDSGGKWGYPRLLNEYRKPHQTKNGYACLLPYSDKNWADFFDYIGRSELKADERYAKLSNRPKHYEFLYSLVAEAAKKRTTEEWVEFCEARSIPCMPVRELADLESDPHLKSVALIQIADHPTEGKYRTVRPPVSFDGRFLPIRRHAPRLGQDSVAVLSKAGLTRQEIDELISEGITEVADEPQTRKKAE